jgi:hypothetical protein
MTRILRHAWLAAVLLLPAIARAYAPSASIFWEPYTHSGGEERLYHLDHQRHGAELVVDEGDGADDTDHAQDDAHPMGGVPLELQGDANIVPGGRFFDGAALQGKGALLLERLGMAKQRTLECWVYLEQYPAASATLLHMPGAMNASFQLTVSKDGGLGMRWGEQTFPAAGSMPLRRWTHIAVNWNWRFVENPQSARLYVNGTQVREYPKLDTDKIAYGTTLVLGNTAALDAGIVGKIDEIRHSPAAVAFYPYQLDRMQPGRAVPPLAPPYLRDSADLLLHLTFDETFAPGADGAQPKMQETELSKRVGASAAPELLGFRAGVLGSALRLGAQSARPSYQGDGWISSTAGTLAFWVRPLGWDTFQSLDWRRNNWETTRIPLFKIFGTLSEEAAPRHPMRGNDPSLLACDLFFLPDSNVTTRVKLHPGAWTHLAVCWQGGQWRYYVDGVPMPPDGAFRFAVRAWYDRDKTMDVFTGSRPARLVFDGQFGRDPRTEGTLIDDFRIYRRPLTPLEIGNLVAQAHPERTLSPLPPLAVSATGNGILGRVQVEATPLLKEYARVATLEAVVSGDKGELSAAQVSVTPNGTTALTVPTGPYDFGTYRVTTRAKAADGTVLAQVQTPLKRVKPRWWQSPAGRAEQPMPGWTPMTVRGNVVGVVNRDLAFAPGGLPAQITASRVPVLRGPVRLEVRRGDAVVALQPAAPAVEVTKATATRVDTRGRVTGGGLQVTTEAFTEYDGLMYFTLTLAPSGREPVALDRLTVTVPYAADSATLLHWWSGKQDFRNPKVCGIRRVPAAPGPVLRSTDAAVERDPRQRGSMIPYVMLTGMQRGLAWFAENDQGWSLQTETPVVQVVRGPDGVDLVLTIIAEPLTLAAPRTVRFGLHPTPVKGLTPWWRSVASAGYAGPMVIDTFSGCNLKGGDGTTFNLLPTGENWADVRAMLAPDQRMMGLVNSDNAAFEKTFRRAPNPEERTVPVLYWDNHWGGGDPAENRECQEAYPRDWWLRPEFLDYASWAFEQWVVETKGAIQGVYLDDMWGVPEPGPCAYRLPDGHEQLGYHFLQVRERVKRLRQILVDRGITPRLTAHSTHTLFIPYHSFFDDIVDGEDHYSTLDSQADFIDHWPLDRILFHHSAKWGFATSWLGAWGGSTSTEKYPAWAFRQRRAYTTLLALADLGSSPLIRQVEPDFHLADPATRCLAAWNGDTVAHTLPAGVHAVAWTRPGQALVLLGNLGNARAEVATTLNLAALGLPATATLRQLDPELLSYFDVDLSNLAPLDDPEAALDPLAEPEEDPLKKLPLAERRKRDPDGKFSWDAGVLSCPVRRHDYRLFLLEHPAQHP